MTSAYHPQPDEVGEVAARANARTLVLTHLMPGSVPADLAARAARTSRVGSSSAKT